MKTKLLAMITVIMMLIAMLPVGVSAADETTAVASVTYNGGTPTYYDTFDAAIDYVSGSVAAGDYVVTLLKGSDESVIITQRTGVNVTVTAENADILFTGNIVIDGGNGLGTNYNGSEYVKFENMNFHRTAEYVGSVYMIHSNEVPRGSSKVKTDYAHNISFIGCNFTDETGTAFGIAMRQDRNLVVSNCTVDGLDTFIWSTGEVGTSTNNSVWTIDQVTMTNMSNGISLTSNACKATITNVSIDAEGYGIRFNPESILATGTAIDSVDIVAQYPIAIRTPLANYPDAAIEFEIANSTLEYTEEGGQGIAVLDRSTDEVITDETIVGDLL